MSDAVSADTFRLLCSQFATGVTIVSTFDPAGAPCGMTANSFASLSLEPPLVSVAVDHAAQIYPVLLAAPRFAVNVLDARQERLSRRFADGLDDRFDRVAWQRSEDDHVILAATLAHLRCDKWAELPAGDHTIFIGRVTGGAVAEDATPLVHYRGAYFSPERGAR